MSITPEQETYYNNRGMVIHHGQHQDCDTCTIASAFAIALSKLNTNGDNNQSPSKMATKKVRKVKTEPEAGSQPEAGAASRGYTFRTGAKGEVARLILANPDLKDDELLKLPEFDAAVTKYKIKHPKDRIRMARKAMKDIDTTNIRWTQVGATVATPTSYAAEVAGASLSPASHFQALANTVESIATMNPTPSSTPKPVLGVHPFFNCHCGGLAVVDDPRDKESYYCYSEQRRLKFGS